MRQVTTGWTFLGTSERTSDTGCDCQGFVGGKEWMYRHRVYFMSHSCRQPFGDPMYGSNLGGVPPPRGLEPHGKSHMTPHIWVLVFKNTERCYDGVRAGGYDGVNLEKT